MALRHSFDAPALGLDLDGTITDSLAFFQILTAVWPGKVYIVTFREDVEATATYVESLGVRFDRVVCVNSFAEKTTVIADLSIKVFIDDMDEVITHIPADVTVLKMRNGGNFEAGKWLYDKTTGRQIK
jgi:hypothetical protein